MESLSGATEEVEQTLRVARQATERQIAIYRVAVFGFLAVVSLAISVSLGSLDFRAPAVAAVLTVYAVAVKRRVDSGHASDRLIYSTIAIDLLGISALFLAPPRDGPSQMIQLHVVAPTFLLVLVVNILRNDQTGSLLASGIAAALLPLVLFRIEPLNPLPFALSLGLGLVGYMGVAAARQARRSLDTFARLRLLRRYLSPQAVERVMRDNPDAAMSLGGRQVTVTLLAADLRDFTAMSERLTPDEVVRQLNAYHGAMLAVVRRHGGILDKFIGDGTLVVFGLPHAQEASPKDCGAKDAVDCAREMLAALERHNGERAARGLPALRMGIGVHTGPVVAGNIGVVGDRLEFTVIGDAVNTAARLETATKEASTPLLVSGDTVAALGGTGGLRELSPVKVKGKQAELRVFAGASANASANSSER